MRRRREWKSRRFGGRHKRNGRTRCKEGECELDEVKERRNVCMGGGAA